MRESRDSTPERLVVEGRLGGFSVEEAWEHWTQPEKIVLWWPDVAHMDLRPGGGYALSWPRMEWHLRGEYTVVDPPRRLGFTWRWDHDPAGSRALDVSVAFDPHPDGGTCLRIEHGPFGTEEAEARQGILEGWIHFGMRLDGLKAG